MNGRLDIYTYTLFLPVPFLLSLIPVTAFDIGPATALRKQEPYWHEYRTFAKMRWIDRELLEIFTTEFRDRTKEYYTWAIREGICTVNGKRVSPTEKVQNGDAIANKVHRHEPPVTAEPIRVLYRNDDEGRLVVVKPGSIPVHAAGRYFKHTLLEMIKSDLGIETVYTANRLDRLTSGLMVCSTTKEAAKELAQDFVTGAVRKAYVCRVRGKFPEGEVVCEEPILTVDRQSGVNIVHPEGRGCKTIFKRLSYDAETDTSAVYCWPITGRTHQIRVHVQWLGHPISNDPVYGHDIWSKVHGQDAGEGSSVDAAGNRILGSTAVEEVVAALKAERDGKEDWARWKDDVLFGGLNRQAGVEPIHVPGPNGMPAQRAAEEESEQAESSESSSSRSQKETPWERKVRTEACGFCEECRIPLLPDPKPEELFIYLHAIKYETDKWSFEDELPWWAREDWGSATQETTDRPASAASLGRHPSLAAQAKGNDVKGAQTTGNRWTPPAQTRILDVPEKRPETPSAVGERLSSSHSLPAIALEVFKGVEDFAQRDILQQTRLHLHGADLEASVSNGSVSHAVLHTSHVFMTHPMWINGALRAYVAGNLNGVRAAYLVLGEEKLESETLDALHRERILLGNSNRQKMQQKRKMKRFGGAVPGGHDAETQASPDTAHAASGPDVELNEEGLAPSEVQLLSLIEGAWTRCEAARERILEVWRTIQTEVHGKIEPAQQNFRATVDRSAYVLPTLTTSQLERHLGELVWTWMNRPDVTTSDLAVKWPVNLTNPTLDITLKLIPGLGLSTDAPPLKEHERYASGGMIFLIKISDPVVQPPHRPNLPNEIVHGGTALARYRAHTVASMLPIPDGDGSGPISLLEPCVGRAGIAIELAAALHRRGRAARIFASDIDEEEIVKATQAVSMSGFAELKDESGVEIRCRTVDGTDLEQMLAFTGEQSVDGLVTDVPWGMRVLTHKQIHKLYAGLLSSFIRILKPGACAIIITAEHKTLRRTLVEEETRRRKSGEGWYLAIEPLVLQSHDEAQREEEGRESAWLRAVEDPVAIRQGQQEAKEHRGARSVQIGYGVLVFQLRKRAL